MRSFCLLIIALFLHIWASYSRELSGIEYQSFLLALPQPPGTLEATPLSSIAVKLTWEDHSENESGFIIERKPEGESFQSVDTTASNASFFIDENLSSGKTYSYRVKSQNAEGESGYSNEAFVKTFSDKDLKNISSRKSALQSSTIYSGFADRGVDGNTDGAFSSESVTHTGKELNAWWEVDLEGVYNINYIEVWNRTDLCCADRMANFNVFISEVPFESYDFQSTINQPGIWRVSETPYPEPVTRFSVAKKGRYIRLQLSETEELCLAELVAMGNNHLSPPVFSTTPRDSVLEGEEYTYACNAIDPDLDSLVFTLVQKPSWLVFNPATKTLSGIAPGVDTANYQVTLIVYDGLYHVEQTFSIRIEHVNRPPVFRSNPATGVNKGELYTYAIIADDEENDLLTMEVPLKPAWLQFVDSTHVLKGIPAKEDVGVHDVTIRVSDGIDAVEQSYQLTVFDSNDPPVFVSQPDTVIEQGAFFSYQFEASDSEDDSLVFLAVNIPEWLSFDGETNTISGVPGQEDVGAFGITISVSDGISVVLQEFLLSITDVNIYPEVISVPILTVYQNSTYGYNFLAIDADGDPLTYTAILLPDWLTFNVSLLIISGTPHNEDVGVHDVKIRVSDGKGHTDHQFQITVIDVNDPPVFTSVPQGSSVIANQPYHYEVTATDPDAGDTLKVSAEVLPDWLTLAAATNGATLQGTPTSANVGTHPVILTVTDEKAVATQEFSIEVLEPTGIQASIALVTRVYPIPSKGVFCFEFNPKVKGKVCLKLFDITGCQLREVQINQNETIMLDLTDLPDNLYLYRITIDGNTSVGKIIKNQTYN